jgi:hypothetical protein
VFAVLIVGSVRVRVLEIGDDGETPIPLAQPDVVADGVANRTRTIKTPESFLDIRNLRGILSWLKLDQNNVSNHGRTLAEQASTSSEKAFGVVGLKNMMGRFPRGSPIRVRLKSSLESGKRKE